MLFRTIPVMGRSGRSWSRLRESCKLQSLIRSKIRQIILASQILLIRAAIVGSQPAIGSTVPATQPVDAVQLKDAVSHAEHALQNIRIKFSEKEEQCDPAGKTWTRYGEARGTAWYIGAPRSKVKIQFDDYVGPWISGLSPFIEKKFTIAFDGQRGLFFEKALGSPGSVSNTLRGTITGDRSPLLDQYSEKTTGWGFSLRRNIRSSLRRAIVRHYYPPTPRGRQTDGLSSNRFSADPMCRDGCLRHRGRRGYF